MQTKPEVYELEVVVPLRVKMRLPTNKVDTGRLIERLVHVFTVQLPICGPDQNPWSFALWPRSKGAPASPRGVITEITSGVIEEKADG